MWLAPGVPVSEEVGVSVSEAVRLWVTLAVAVELAVTLLEGELLPVVLVVCPALSDGV